MADAERAAADASQAEAARHAALQRLAGGVAHELNNGLMLIDGCAQLLGMDAAAAPFAEDLDAIQRAIARLTELSTRLQRYAQRRHVVREPLTVAALLDALGGGLAVEGGPRVRLEPPGEELAACSLRADAAALTRVAGLLAQNSREAGSSQLVGRSRRQVLESERLLGGRALPAGSWLMIELIDDGVGLEPALAGVACEPWVSGRTERKALGLGLSEAWGVLGAHGGTLLIAPRVAPPGCCVTLWLPLG